MRYSVRLMETGNGGFAVWVPALPGCRSFGRTESEALERIRSAIACYLEALEEQNSDLEAREVDVG